jgi:hypothetical protein
MDWPKDISSLPAPLIVSFSQQHQDQLRLPAPSEPSSSEGWKAPQHSDWELGFMLWQMEQQQKDMNRSKQTAPNTQAMSLGYGISSGVESWCNK